MKANTRPKEVEIFDLDKTFIHFITSNFTTRLYIQLKKKSRKKGTRYASWIQMPLITILKYCEDWY